MTPLSHKTRIVCTIGPASETPEILEAMILAGMNVARLNFSHGEFGSHGQRIEMVRAAAAATGRRVAIMADLPGPKIRIGDLEVEPIELLEGDPFTLTILDTPGTCERVSVGFMGLVDAVRPGDRIFLNDGFIGLKVREVTGDEVRCVIRTGGELRSRKGLNLPDADLGIPAFTPRDRECLEFALKHGVEAVSQSFVATAADIEDVRAACAEIGRMPFIVAKLELASAREHVDEILDVSDGIMVARGDLGVEIPIELIAIAQKRLIRSANVRGRPVITATHMLESMCKNRRPTRAEATDVANAVLDGTDAVMLSGESAIGKYPVESVRMLASIAGETEPLRSELGPPPAEHVQRGDVRNFIAASIDRTARRDSVTAVVVPTLSGDTARRITRYRLPVPILAVSPSAATCQELQFSYGVEAIHMLEHEDKGRALVKRVGLDSGIVLIVEGPSPENPERTHRMEIVDLG